MLLEFWLCTRLCKVRPPNSRCIVIFDVGCLAAMEANNSAYDLHLITGDVVCPPQLGCDVADCSIHTLKVALWLQETAERSPACKKQGNKRLC